MIYVGIVTGMTNVQHRQYVEIGLEPDERHQLKVRAVAEQLTVKEMVTKAIRQYLRTPIDKRDKRS
jgi:hypothetical protein